MVCNGRDHHHLRSKGPSAEEQANEGPYVQNKTTPRDKVTSAADVLSKEDSLRVSRTEHELAKAEALIRECQRVECYLSSLSKHPLDSLPEKTKGLPCSAGSLEGQVVFGSLPGKCRSSGDNLKEPHRSPGSLEEQVIFNRPEKSHSNCRTPSPQDDEVFLADEHSSQQGRIKLDSPESENLAKGGSFPTTASQGGRQLVECAIASSLANDPQQYSPEEMNSDNHTELTVPNASAQVKTSVIRLEINSRSKGKGVEWKKDNEKWPNGTIPHHSVSEGEFLKSKPEMSSQDRGTGDGFLSFEDDFCIVELQTEGGLSETRSFDGFIHTSGSPRGVLTMLKQGFKSIFTKKTAENGRRPAPCFVPCLQQPLPQEHFQIREFPQSSLPSGPAVDDSPHTKVNTQLDSGDSTSACDTHTGLHSRLLPHADATRNGVWQRQNFDQNRLAYQNPLKNQPEKCAPLSVASAPPCSRNCGAGRSTNFPEGTSSLTSAEADVSLSSTARQKGDTVNTDLCRFYHVFREGELVSLVTQHVPGVKVVDSFYDHANWCLILKKV